MVTFGETADRLEVTVGGGAQRDGERRPGVFLVEADGCAGGAGEPVQHGVSEDESSSSDLDRLPVDLGDELRVGVEPRLPCPPVIARSPGADEPAQPRQGKPYFPPAGAAQRV